MFNILEILHQVLNFLTDSRHWSGLVDTAPTPSHGAPRAHKAVCLAHYCCHCEHIDINLGRTWHHSGKVHEQTSKRHVQEGGRTVSKLVDQHPDGYHIWEYRDLWQSHLVWKQLCGWTLQTLPEEAETIRTLNPSTAQHTELFVPLLETLVAEL